MKENTLHILWTNDNPTTSKLMVMMYALNAKKQEWFDNVTVIIWGATAKLVAENKTIQEEINKANSHGVVFSACKACAVELGVDKKLEDLDLEVIYWGEPLTSIIKNKDNLITV